MEKFLIRIGDVILNVSQIVSVDIREDSMRIYTTLPSAAGAHYVTITGAEECHRVLFALEPFTITAKVNAGSARLLT